MSITANHGFRIVGPTTGERKLIDWHRAFAAYCAADDRARIEREAYLSAFAFPDDFRDHLNRVGSTKGYSGVCGAPWLWLDIDRDDDLEAARRDAAAICVQLGERFGVDDDSLLAFHSGSKGFHVGLPLCGFNPEPSADFHKICRRVAEQVAESASVTIDAGIYDRVRAFRAPNSKHPKTGRYKRRFTVDELTHLDANRIIDLAAKPEPFDLDELGDGRCGVDLPAEWNDATKQVRVEAEAKAEQEAAIASGDAEATVNRQTLGFIREGASSGDRHRLLFSASANLAECGASVHLCEQLLGESARDSGLPPADIARQIRCGYEHAKAAELTMVRDVLDTFPNAEIVDVSPEGGVA